MVAEPITGKEILTNDHSTSHNDGIGNTQIAITGKAIAAEDGTADNGLEQIVGKTHTSENTQMMQHLAHALRSIPCRNDGRHNHHQYHQIVDRVKPRGYLAKIHNTQHNYHQRRSP